jgi:putative ABC transport system ATP-binding protein
MADALVLDGVSKVYEVGGIELIALHDVDLTVAQEEVVTLLGPSGSGKTTLLSIAGGLLSATTGKVIVGGKNITRARARKLTAFRRKRIGFIFQAVNLVPFLTARENLLVVAELARRDRAAAAKRADRLLEELGLGHRLGNLPAQLSGGERQRVAIGRALMNQPALVLVDEPTSALDSDLGQQVMELIVAEVKARGAAAVIVTHDQRMARYGDRILTMADGRIAGMAPRPEFTLDRGSTPPAGARPRRALPAAAPAPSPFTAAPASGQWPAATDDLGPATGDVHAPAARFDPDAGSGRWPATGNGTDGAALDDGAAAASAARFDPGAASGQWPATGNGTGGAAVDDGASAPAAGDGWGGGAPGFRPPTGPVPAAGGQRRWVPPALRAGFPPADPVPDADAPGFAPRTGPVPAAGGAHEVPAGLWANGPAVTSGAGAGSASASWPAVDDARGRSDARPASGAWPAVDDAPGRFDDRPVSGAWPAVDDAAAGGTAGWPSPDSLAAERERREVPHGLWANGPAVTSGTSPGRSGAGRDERRGGGRRSGPATGPVPATGRRPDPYDGLPGPRDDAPAAHAGPPSGQLPIAQPVSAQHPVVPAPDRVWRRPSTPAPAARPGGARRPPQLRPAHPAAPSPVPPAAWPEPQAPEPPEYPAPAPWGTPEFFAEPPQVPGSGYPPAAAPPQADEADPVESDRVRWLQQLTPPPTKSQPRPLALPDRPIWPTRYWDDGTPRPPDGDDPGDPAYDFGEYDDEA